MHTEFKKIAVLLKKAQKIAIISHKNPDGDTVGANMGLRYSLESIGKEVTSICQDTIPDKFYFLPNVTTYIKTLDPGRYDLIFLVDIAAKSLIGFEPRQKELFSFFPLVNLDHHPDNQLFGNVNAVDATAASATTVIFKLLQFLQIPITRNAATALLLGLYTDTGSFMHGNTSKESYHIAGRLLSCGGNSQLISQRIFRNFPVNRLRLWGEVFSRIKVNEQNVVSSVVTKDDFRHTNSNAEDLNGVVEYLNMVPDIKYAMLLTEDEQQHQVKASLRTLNDNVDVSSIAHQFGGGGHKKASAFRISGKIEEEVTWKVVNEDDKDVMKI